MVKLYVHKRDYVLNVDMILLYDYQQHHMICKHLCIFRIVHDWVNILGFVNTMLFVNNINIKPFVNICRFFKLYKSVYILDTVDILINYINIKGFVNICLSVKLYRHKRVYV